jgi:multidrug efflux pump subunit AcrA (membrane-fusion protein)
MMDKDVRDEEMVSDNDLQPDPMEADSENYLVVEHLKRMPSIFSRGLIYLLVILLVIGAVCVIFVKVDIVVECMSVARPVTEEIRVLSKTKGHVEKVFVSEGQNVEKGSLLFLIRPTAELRFQAESDDSSKHVKAEEGVIVRSETAGTVLSLFVRQAGVSVKESDALCSILSSGGALYMDIWVKNKDIGFIEKRMPIRYKFDAFHYSDFGTMHGNVDQIAPSAVEDQHRGFIFHIQGKIDTPYFEIKGKRYAIKPGMTATAELVTGRRSLLSLVVAKFR